MPGSASKANNADVTLIFGFCIGVAQSLSRVTVALSVTFHSKWNYVRTYRPPSNKTGGEYRGSISKEVLCRNSCRRVSQLTQR